MKSQVFRTIVFGSAIALAACSPSGDSPAQSSTDLLQSQESAQNVEELPPGDVLMSDSALPEQISELCYLEEDICAGVYLSSVRPEIVVALKADHPGTAALEEKIVAKSQHVRVRHVRFSEKELHAAFERLFEAAGDRASFGGSDIYGNGITVGIKDVEPGGGIILERQLPDKARQVYEELVDAGYSVRIEPGDEGYNFLEFEPEDPSGQSN